MIGDHFLFKPIESINQNGAWSITLGEGSKRPYEWSGEKESFLEYQDEKG